MNTLRQLLKSIQRESTDNGSMCERKAAKSLASAYIALLEALDLADAPTVTTRVHDAMSTFLIAYRIDEELWAQGVFLEGERKDEGAHERILNPLVEQSAKAHERMRKAMKELEDTCAKAGKPINEGLPDKVRDLMKKAELAIEKIFEAQADDKDNH